MSTLAAIADPDAATAETDGKVRLRQRATA